MDIVYLLALQELREFAPLIFEEFLLAVSFIGNGPALIALVLIVYWCVDKRAGQFVLFSYCIANLLGQFLKAIACVYRPWVLDERIVPSERALHGATGYSFPSGHTVGTGSVMGSFAWLLWKKHRAIALACCAFTLLMMFSRNALGVHTPQDVIVGLVVAIVGIALVRMLMTAFGRAEARKPNGRLDIVFSCIAMLALIASIAFAMLKPYPMDYVDGMLLMDPESMQKDFLQSAGIAMGVVLGWLLERRFVKFSTDGLMPKERVIRAVIGIAIVGLSFALADIAFKAVLPYIWAKTCSLFVLSFVALACAPAVFQAIEKRRQAVR